MSSIVTDNSNGYLAKFRQFAREIRQPRPYVIGVSEFKGILNIIIGVGQLLACPFLSPKQYVLHKELGKTALQQAVRDLSRLMVVSAIIGTGLTARRLLKL